MSQRLLSNADLRPGEVIRGLTVVRDVDTLTGGFARTPDTEAARARIIGQQDDAARERLIRIITGEQPIVCRHTYLRQRRKPRLPWWTARWRRRSFDNLMHLTGHAPRHVPYLLETGGIDDMTLWSFLYQTRRRPVRRWRRHSPLPETVRRRLLNALLEHLDEHDATDPAARLESALRHPDEWSRPRVSAMLNQAVESGEIAKLYADGDIALNTVLALIDRNFMTMSFEPPVKTSPPNRRVTAGSLADINPVVDTGEITKLLDAETAAAGRTQ